MSTTASHARIGRIRMKNGGAEIVPLRLVHVGEGFRFNPDELLAKALGRGFTNLLIIGELPDDDELYLVAMANAGEALIMMERAKLQMIDPT